MEREDGFQHNGTFVVGAMDGHARRRYSDDASVYEGDFLKGKRHGHGSIFVQVDEKKWWKYEGQFINDKMQGEGTMTRSNGSLDPKDWFVKSGTFPLKEEWVWEESVVEEDLPKEKVGVTPEL